MPARTPSMTAEHLEAIRAHTAALEAHTAALTSNTAALLAHQAAISESLKTLDRPAADTAIPLGLDQLSLVASIDGMRDRQPYNHGPCIGGKMEAWISDGAGGLRKVMINC